MSSARQRKARQARRVAQHRERIKPTPETAAKLRPHPMELLLTRGRDGGGIDADQWQCAEEIVEARDCIGVGLGLSSNDMQAMAALGFATRSSAYGDVPVSKRAEWLTRVWQAWAAEMDRRWHMRRPFLVVDRIESRRPCHAQMATALGAALDLWAKVRGDLARPGSTNRPNAG